ncbi:MAG TPA: ATP-binding protein [Pyrinomonadaceae bacterium]
MKLPNLFYSFRMRLLLVLALLLFATLGVQYYLFYREEMRRAAIISEQEQALAASTALALESITTPTRQYLWEMDETRPVSFLQEQAGRVQNVLVINEQGRVDDSLDPQFAPRTVNGEARYYHVSELNLPRLVVAGPVTEDLMRLINAPEGSAATTTPIAGEPRAFTMQVRLIDEEGGPTVNYIIVVLGATKTPQNDSWEDILRPLLPTLAVLLLATTAAAILVWRFTRPIKALSRATQRVASGHFDFRVPGGHRRDETGVLVSTFNEMIAGLSHTRELEVKVKQAEQSAVVGRLASAIAHEVRNPLNYINLTLDHLRTSLAPEDPQKRELFGRLANQLKAEVARINTRITEFLKYSRPAALDLKPIDLGALLDDALRMVEVQAEETGVRTAVEREGGALEVLGDRESLRSVFTNLIINGMQAMGSEGGSLTIRLSSDDGVVRVGVSDTGRGIPPDNLPKIFEPYFSTKETGTGLGLAIVKKAVDDHGGHITVESKQDEGTTFTVTLPIGERGQRSEVRGQ